MYKQITYVYVCITDIHAYVFLPLYARDIHALTKVYIHLQTSIYMHVLKYTYTYMHIIQMFLSPYPLTHTYRCMYKAKKTIAISQPSE